MLWSLMMICYRTEVVLFWPEPTICEWRSNRIRPNRLIANTPSTQHTAWIAYRYHGFHIVWTAIILQWCDSTLFICVVVLKQKISTRRRHRMCLIKKGDCIAKRLNQIILWKTTAWQCLLLICACLSASWGTLVSKTNCFPKTVSLTGRHESWH